MKNILFLLTFISFSVVGQNLITPSSVTGSFFSGSTNRAIDNSGLSSIPTTVVSAMGVTHSSPASISEASYTPNGFSPTTPWTFNFSTAQSLQGMVLWQPCSPHNGGDAPFNKITISYMSCGVNIIDTFILGLPSINSKIIYFSQPIIGITSITLNVLESWSYNSLASGSCDVNVGWTSVTALPAGSYNVMIGEVKFIDGSLLNPCSNCNLTANFSTSNTCFGDNTLFSDLSIDSLGTIVNWQWYFGDGDSIVGVNNPTHMYTTSGTFNAILAVTNDANCVDSVTLNVTINNSNAGTDTRTACNSFTWIDGNVYISNNNTATFTLTNAGGCDSIVVLNLTINNSSATTDTHVACDTYTWIDGNTYTLSNNTAIHLLTNAVGCDSVVTLDLTINNSNTSLANQVACDSYTWIDGNTYTASNNTATHVLTNAAGCDSVISLNLTIKNSTTGIDTHETCVSYTWIDGNTYTTNNNTATFTLTNVIGCDSVVTLNLTISLVLNTTDTQIACDSYTWIDGNIYNTSNNVATHTLTAAAGCDSIVTLDLTIKNSSTSTDIHIACDSFTWIDGNTYTISNNTATQTLTNAVGCDSIVTLDLTINNSIATTDTQVVCNSFTWSNGTTYTSNNNTATFTLTSVTGCDSVITLDLTINSVDTVVTQSNDTLTSNESGATYQWIDCGNGNILLAGDTNQSYIATANGNFAVIITNNGCLDTSACYTVTGVGIINNNFENKLLLYPNPTDGNFSIDLGQHYQVVKITITDLRGRVVQSNTYNESQLLNLKLEEPAGVYLLKIESENNNAVIRLVKE